MKCNMPLNVELWVAGFILTHFRQIFPFQLRDLHFVDYENFLVELAGFQISEAHNEHDAARSDYEVPFALAQEEETPQHKCPVPGR